MASNTAICWLRRDLRFADNVAVAEACENFDQVVVVFVFDTTILSRLQDRDDRRVSFIHQSLLELDKNLRRHNANLAVLHGDPTELIPDFARRLGARAVVCARDYEPDAISRDAAVMANLSAMGIQFTQVKDSVILEAGEVLTESGSPFRVFTPYSRAWRFQLRPLDIQEKVARPEKLAKSPDPATDLSHFSLATLGFSQTDLWTKPGEAAGANALDAFAGAIDDYGATRDYPALNGTSGLSVHLRFGTVGIRQAVRTANASGSPGAEKWLTELIWRDFYQDVLFHNPATVDQPFQPQYKTVEYPGSPEFFRAWTKGETGYPIIDAAMRSFAATGYMHNRLRMITASFLTKDLLCDWRSGERFFARLLLDFDLASNVGGWQWSASVGADAQPYFRIFNPVLQSQKFDSDGVFIRTWLPELANLSNEAIHFPAKVGALELAESGVRLGKNYPHPIVDHFEQRPKAIRLLEEASQKR